MARQKRIRHAASELVERQYVQRHTRKGWMERDFNIGGQWFRWRKNIQCRRGVLRLGVPCAEQDVSVD